MILSLEQVLVRSVFQIQVRQITDDSPRVEPLLEAGENEVMVDLELAHRFLDDEGGIVSLTELRKANGLWVERLHLPNGFLARLEVESGRGHRRLEDPGFGMIVAQGLAGEEAARFRLEYA